MVPIEKMDDFLIQEHCWHKTQGHYDDKSCTRQMRTTFQIGLLKVASPPKPIGNRPVKLQSSQIEAACVRCARMCARCIQ